MVNLNVFGASREISWQWPNFWSTSAFVPWNNSSLVSASQTMIFVVVSSTKQFKTFATGVSTSAVIGSTLHIKKPFATSKPSMFPFKMSSGNSSTKPS